jgi:hypothetical protein
MCEHGYGGAARLRPRIDRPHERPHQSDPALRLVQGGDAEGREALHRAGISALDVADDDSVHGRWWSCRLRGAGQTSFNCMDYLLGF